MTPEEIGRQNALDLNKFEEFAEQFTCEYLRRGYSPAEAAEKGVETAEELLRHIANKLQ